MGTGKARGRGRFRPSLPSLPGLPKLGGRGRKTAARKNAKAARARGPSQVMGVRRVKSGARKGQWQRYRKATKRQQVRPRARHAGEYAVVPFAVAWAGGRYFWRRARRKPKPPPPKLTVHRPVRAPAARGPAAPVPAARPAPAQPPSRKVRLYDSERGPTIMNHLDAASESVHQHVGAFKPENASDLDKFLSALPQFFEIVGQSFWSVAMTLSDGYPVHQSVPERLFDIAATIRGMSDFSGEAHAVHRTMHQTELERIENPRPREEFWDVSRQD